MFGIAICPVVWKVIQSFIPKAQVPLQVPSKGDDEPLILTPSYAPIQPVTTGVQGFDG